MAEELSILKIGSQLKEAFSKFSHLQLGEGFGKLAQLGGDIINFGISAFTAYLIVDILQNENLKTSQKIIPTIGYSLGILVTLPLAILIIAGVATLIPPFVFAASCVSVVRDTATYLEERSERNNLKKEMISTNKLLKNISDAKLSTQTEQMVQAYLQGRDKIYTELYAARQAIITDGSLGVQEKKEKVLTLNKIIEDFYSANQDPANKQLPQLYDITDKLKNSGLTSLSEQLKDYSQVCETYSQSTLPSTLKKSIALYQFTHEKIYSQDLPALSKQKYIQLIEGKKIASDDLKLLYADLGNRFLNQTPLMQIKVMDDNFEEKLRESGLTQDQQSFIKEYNQQPRFTYDKVIQLRENLPTLLENDPNKQQKIDLFEKFRVTLINFPQMYHDDWNAFKSQFSDTFIFSAIENELSKLDKTSAGFDQLSINDEQKSYIQNHRNTNFTQYANSHQAEFPAPRFDFDLKANDLLERAGIKTGIKKVFSKVDKGFHKISDKVKENVMRKLAKKGLTPEEEAQESQQSQMSEAKKDMRKDFNQRYQGIFNVVEKKERLNFLIKSVPRRLINIGLASIVALVSLATTIIIPAVATPGAPAAAAAATALGILSTALSVASLANSATLIYKNIKGKLKLRATHTTVTEGVIPNLHHDEKQLKTANKEISKRDGLDHPEVKIETDISHDVKPLPSIPKPLPTASKPSSETSPAVLLAKIIHESKPLPLKPVKDEKNAQEGDKTKSDKKP
jgi:hypothetical protein